MTRNKRAKVQVRIISGKWRGRKLNVSGGPDLRPTPGRTRETLFNWLRAELPGSHCLDLFAGSGVLGLEALSQGAASVTWVERDRLTSQSLAAAMQQLQIGPPNQLVQAEALAFLGRPQPGPAWEIVFLDPPYRQPQLLEAALQRTLQILPRVRYLYVEGPSEAAIEGLAAAHNCGVHRRTRSGDSYAGLLTRLAGN